MSYINRKITEQIQSTLKRGKSVLLVGARQTGKTTLINHEIKPDITYSFVDPETRLRYEKNPALLSKELKIELQQCKTPPLIFIDEIQKLPSVMDTAQFLIDQKQAQFILTGSSVRKLKHGTSINLLPGRIIEIVMDPFHIDELPKPLPNLNDLLLYGTLPSIITEPNLENKESDLHAYVTAYLEEEIRAEAHVRNVGNFSKFLELAASEAGHIINFSKLSQEIGIVTTTVIDYFQVLEDCMIVYRIDPITKSTSHRRLIKSPKYLFFDLGIRRACTNEGTALPELYLSKLFEQYIGIELIHQCRTHASTQIKYWRDASGIEVDFVVETSGHYIPIEVKWSEMPTSKDIKHLQKFLNEYQNANKAFVICRTPKAFEIADNIIALPWQDLAKVMVDKPE